MTDRAGAPYKTIPLVGRQLPQIILGTSKLGSILPDAVFSAPAREPTFLHLDDMLELGCSAFDLAASYQLGGTERLIGSWMQSRRNRDRLFLITKGGHPYPVVQPHRLTPRALSDDLHASLRRLRTEHVELYLLHRDDPGAPLEPIVETLASHQQQGQIGAWGVSNWTHARIRALDKVARSSGASPISASSPQFSLAAWASPPWNGCVSISGDDNDEARAFYQGNQMPVLAWSPLGHGFLSRPAGGEAPRGTLRTYGTKVSLARRLRAEALAQKYQVTPVQIALSYLFSQPFPVFAIVSASTREKMRSNLEATRQRLSPHDLRWLESGHLPEDAS
jgi:aryl-alcohol dehydrogenase-like predicted oxidoreductase